MSVIPPALPALSGAEGSGVEGSPCLPCLPRRIDDAKQTTTLEQAGVARARLVAVTANNIETALLVAKRTPESNPNAPIVVHCFLDEFTETLGATLVISSSKSAFGEMARYFGGSD